MTHILLVSPKLEIVVHNIPVFDNTDVKKIKSFIKNKEEQYGELERIIISMGTVRIMDQKDEIPVPLRWGGGRHARIKAMTERQHDLALNYVSIGILCILVLHNYQII